MVLKEPSQTARLASQSSASADASRIMAQRAKSFTAAARFLPGEERAAVQTLYLFCRVADDFADDHGLDDADALAALAELSAWLDDSGPTGQVGSLQHDLVTLIQERSLDRRLFRCLLDGVRSDRLQREREDWGDLRRYCFQVAGSVGILLSQLFGIHEPAAISCAATLGVAMQLTNIIRDVGEDLQNGRVYLPRDELKRFGYSRERLERQVVDEDFVALLRCQIERARSHFAAGLVGVYWLPPEVRFPIALAGRLYAAILDEVEANGYDVFHRRASTSTPRKLALAATTYVGLRLSGWHGRKAWSTGGDSLQTVAAVVASELMSQSEG